ncbi:hypothetical protein PROFUN_04539 [Planoprotostelium fungivorum]|uniref:Protein kinase domain-containing protein n=1 Tax=Planoprotostelium fungivorum TaxID=1890364 RepID=A0A2P6NBG9_9EUKA|nr:hypothetical protein PROFUN_04539 [Planoprotostelium fungivorum]
MRFLTKDEYSEQEWNGRKGHQILMNRFRNAPGKVASQNDSLDNTRFTEVAQLEIIEVVGQGGFGTVFHATAGHQHLVLKTMMKTPSRSMEPVARREYDLGMKLKHPNLVRMRGSFDTDTDHCLVMDLVKGVDLFTFLEDMNFANLPESRVKKMFKGLAKGLEYSHRQGIAHLDIKPENIMVSEDDHLTLIDFGLAAETRLCHQFKGTHNYASPEIWKQTPYDPRCADVWSLGIVLYILLTGRLPFDPSDNAKELIDWMLEVRPRARPTMKEVLNHRWLKKSMFSKRRWSLGRI